MSRTALLLALLAAVPFPAAGQNCLIPSNQFVDGGPGKDGIPSLTSPPTVSAAEGDRFLQPTTLVLGVVVNGQARAYPHNILWWHEIVNDVLGGRAITVSYCPLTGSGMAYDPVVDGEALSFGVSGLLFDNNLLLYDRKTQSLWSQMRAQSVCGSLAGRVPPLVPVVQSTWEAWRRMHPETTVVSFDTGHRRNYGQYPYGSYDQVGNTQLLFPQSFTDARRPMKELVLGLTHQGVSRAYPYTALGERAAINDELAGLPVLVVFDRLAQMALPFDRSAGDRTLTFEVVDEGAFPFMLRDRESGSLWDLSGLAVSGVMTGQRVAPIATYSAMWFAWAAFHRDTEIYAAPSAASARR